MIYAELLHPGGKPPRVWLRLRDDEAPPEVMVLQAGVALRWSSLWPARPGVVIDFEVTSDGGDGSLLTWTMLSEDPEPDAATVGHLRRRVQELINGELRRSFGQ